MHAGAIAGGVDGDLRVLAVHPGKSGGGERLSPADFQDIVARLCTRLSLTPAEARAIEVPDYLDLAASWARSPPQDILIEILARLWGWKPAPPEPPQISFDEAVAAQGDAFKLPRRWFN